MKKWLPWILTAFLPRGFCPARRRPNQERLRRGGLGQIARAAQRACPAAGFGGAQFAPEHQRRFHPGRHQRRPLLGHRMVIGSDDPVRIWPISGKSSAFNIPIWPANWARPAEGLANILLQRPDQPNSSTSKRRRRTFLSPSGARARRRRSCGPLCKRTCCTCITASSCISGSRTASSRRAPGISRGTGGLRAVAPRRTRRPAKYRSGQARQPGGFAAHHVFLPTLRGDGANRLSLDHSPCAGPTAPGLVQLGDQSDGRRRHRAR